MGSAPASPTSFGPDPDTGMYDYDTPEGYQDIFFVYAFDANAAALVNGDNYTFLQINVTDGGFVCRAWNGAYAVLNTTPGTLGTIQIYGAVSDKWFDSPTNCYTPNPQKQCAAVIPEKQYPVDGAIRFDLTNVLVRSI